MKIRGIYFVKPKIKKLNVSKKLFSKINIMIQQTTEDFNIDNFILNKF